MINTILIIASMVLFIMSLLVLILDLTSSKRNPEVDNKKKLTKKNGYSILFALLGLILITIVSFSYVP